MDCGYLKLSSVQLEDFKKGLKRGELWSKIYTLFKEPDHLCELAKSFENGNESNKEDESLRQSVDSTTSMFIAKISVEDKYRAYNIVKLLRTEICNNISIFNELYIEFGHSKKSPLSGKEVKIITDPIFNATMEGTVITWDAFSDERLNKTTDLYIIGTVKAVRVFNEETIDDVLKDSSDIELGENKNNLLKRAELHRKNGACPSSLTKKIIVKNFFQKRHKR